MPINLNIDDFIDSEGNAVPFVVMMYGIEENELS